MHRRAVATEPCNNHVHEPRYTIQGDREGGGGVGWGGWVGGGRELERSRREDSACMYRVYIACRGGWGEEGKEWDKHG